VRYASVLAGADKVSIFGPERTALHSISTHKPVLQALTCDEMDVQAPLSRVEPGQFLNERYSAIEDRLAVGLPTLNIQAPGLCGLKPSDFSRRLLHQRGTHENCREALPLPCIVRGSMPSAAQARFVCCADREAKAQPAPDLRREGELA